MGNFRTVLSGGDATALLNSLELAFIATVVSIVPGILGGYALSRRRIPARDGLMVSVLFLTAVPVGIVVIPLYEVFAKYNLLTLVPTAIFVGVTNLPFALWLIKTAMDTVPKELEEAASIERANLLQILVKVTLPSSIAGVVAALFFSFTSAWGAFLIPLVLVSSPSQATGPLALYGFIHAGQIQYGDIAAFSVVYALPVVVLYAGVSRMVSGGFALGGAVKG